MRVLRPRSLVAFAAMAVLSSVALPGAASAAGPGGVRPAAQTCTSFHKGPLTVRCAAGFGVSKPAYKLHSAAVGSPNGPMLEPGADDGGEGSLIHPTGDGSYSGDKAIQGASSGSSGIPPTIENFEGNDIGDNGILGSAPPDTNGDVGETYYVQTVNTVFSVWTKDGRRVMGPTPINALFENSPQADQFNCDANNQGDPIVQYDQLAKRWLISEFGFPREPLATGEVAPPFDQCIAISQTSDPTGQYYLYDFHYSNTVFNDYPHFGVWPDAYYMSVNQFDYPAENFDSAGACAYERLQMINGNPLAQQVCFDESAFDPGAADGNFQYGGQLPADLDGTTLPPGCVGPLFTSCEPNFFMQFHDSTTAGDDQLWEFKFHVDWADPAKSTFGNGSKMGVPVKIPVADFSSNLCDYNNPNADNPRNCLPEKGVTDADKLDAIPDRLMYRLPYRNLNGHESILAIHTVDVGDTKNHAGIRWYEIRNPNGATPNVRQQSTFAPDAEHRWMGSIAMDEVGNVALGYSLTSKDRHPAIAYTGRLAGDPLGTMTLGQGVVIQGPGSQEDTGNRWGDYSSMSVDPNGCTFWYTQEYSTGTGSFEWGTRIGSFQLPTCGDPQVGVGASSDLVRVRSNFSYKIAVTTGANPAPATVVTDLIPNGVTVRSVTPSTGSCTGTTSVTCDLGNLPAGALETIDIDVHAADTGFLTNSVSMTTTSLNDDTANNSGSVVTQVFDPCDLPGAIVAADASGDQIGSTQNDLLTTGIAEPYFQDGSHKLVFTIKVADLNPQPQPNSYWYAYFSYGGVSYYVNMETADDPATPMFKYGRQDPDPTTGINFLTDLGDADSGSWDTNGTIHITLSNSKLNQNPDINKPADGTPPGPDDALTGLHGETRTLVGAGGSGLILLNDSSSGGAYTLSGNAFCAPNLPPVPSLAATPVSGVAPLVVNFDATATTDPDPGDVIQSYTFNFGDGSPPFTSGVPAVEHTYQNSTASTAQHQATVKATDSRGLQSAASAPVTITVQPQGTPPPSRLSIDDFVHVEGNSGTTAFRFKITRVGKTGKSASVLYTTRAGTAKPADGDFRPVNGKVTFSPGDKSKTVTVGVGGDRKREQNEVFFVKLSGSSGVAIADNQALGTIVNDDAAPGLSINDVTHPEGNKGKTPFKFRVSLASPSSRLVRVDWAAGNGTATFADHDFRSASGTLTFQPGQSHKVVEVDVLGDKKVEPREFFLVGLSAPVNATLADRKGRGIIGNDDHRADISVTQADSQDPVTVGDFLVYKVRVRNDGPSTPRRVTLKDVLPERSLFVSLHSSLKSGKCSRTGRVLLCRFGPLAPGQTASFRIKVIPTYNRKITNFARASSGLPDPDSTDHRSAEPTVVRQPACTIKGNKKANDLVGSSGHDVICGRGGNDRIRGSGGNDVVYGGGGNDQIIGGKGFDVLKGQEGDDAIDAVDGTGHDYVAGGAGRDICQADSADKVRGCNT